MNVLGHSPHEMRNGAEHNAVWEIIDGNRTYSIGILYRRKKSNLMMESAYCMNERHNMKTLSILNLKWLMSENIIRAITSRWWRHTPNMRPGAARYYWVSLRSLYMKSIFTIHGEEQSFRLEGMPHYQHWETTPALFPPTLGQVNRRFIKQSTKINQIMQIAKREWLTE